MIGLLQRVAQAGVTVEGREDDRGDARGNVRTVARIGPGLLVLVGVEQGDDEATARRLLEKLLNYRVFPDQDRRMNRSLADAGGGLLLVPQFTLAADTRKGTRPSFSSAAPPEEGKRLFDALVTLTRAAHPEVATGVFGAHMQVDLVNDGPVTFWLRVPPPT